jgi:hypothetical protein
MNAAAGTQTDAVSEINKKEDFIVQEGIGT